MPIYTALYVGPLALILLVLSFRVIGMRYKARLAIGSGGDKRIERAMRVQANFAEYVPFALIAIAATEIAGASLLLVNGLGIALVVGRLSHAIGVSQMKEPLILRQIGTVLTTSVIFIASATASVLAAIKVFSA